MAAARTVSLIYSKPEAALLYMGVDCWECDIRGRRIAAKQRGDTGMVAQLDRQIADCRNLKRRLLRAEIPASACKTPGRA